MSETGSERPEHPGGIFRFVNGPLATEAAMAECTFKRVMGRWFWGTFGITALLVHIISTLSGPDPMRQLAANRDQIFTLINFIATFFVVGIAASEIPRDVGSNVLLTILARPIRRYQVVVGKFVGVFLLGLIFLLGNILVAALSLWLKGLPPDGTFLKLAGLTCMRCFVVVSVATFFATGMAEIPTMIFALIFIAFAHAIPYVLPIFTASVIPAAVKLLVAFFIHLIPDLTYFSPPDINLLHLIGGGQISFKIRVLETSLPPSWWRFLLACLYALTYSFLFLAGSVLSFRRRLVA
jgi:ABC-type transport system involved in multi-copper enzyme maturation permease subunit